MSYNTLITSVYLPATAPTGSIAPYLYSFEPEGWIFCDGVQRTNTDNRYNTLISLGIGSGTPGNSYTPPTLNAAFLRGTGTDSTSTYSGPSLKAFQEQQIIDHGHSFGNHAHTTVDSTTKSYGLAVTGKNTGRGFDATVNEYNIRNNWLKLNDATTTSVQLTAETYSVRNPTGGDETRPYNYGVNWILKL